MNSRVSTLLRAICTEENTWLRKPEPLRCSGARLTNRSSGRVMDKVPSAYSGARAAQLKR